MRCKTLFALCIFCLTATAAAARSPLGVEWGLKGGVSFSDFSSHSVADLKAKTGFQFGIMAGVRFGRLAIRPEIMYVRQSVDITPVADGPRIAVKSNAIDIPVLLSCRLFGPLHVYGGPVFTVLDSCKYTDLDGVKIDFGNMRPTASYAVGLNLKLLGHLIVDARYNGHFSSSSNVFASGGQEVRMRHSSVMLGVGYLF